MQWNKIVDIFLETVDAFTDEKSYDKSNHSIK